MNKFFNITSLGLSAFLLSMSILCQADTPSSTPSKSNPHKAMPNKGSNQGKIYGKVIETIRAGNYTYVHVDTGKKKHWAAAPPITLKKGSMVSFVPNMPMRDFTSKTLNRKFDIVYFVGRIYTDKAGNHPVKTASTPAKPVADIKKAINGNTINEVLTQKQKLAGKNIRVRGLVVKYTAKVMGKNWIHIRDSSSSKDLTVTTAGTTKKGDVVLVSGKLQLNRDFGYGYSYDVLLEDSTIIIE